MRRERLSPREAALWMLVDASHERGDDEARRALVMRAREALTIEEVHDAMTVIALFNYYNAFVDLHGVDRLTPEGYAATGVRLSTQGYAPPGK
jgi:hypothetical protein